MHLQPAQAKALVAARDDLYRSAVYQRWEGNLCFQICVHSLHGRLSAAIATRTRAKRALLQLVVVG